MEDLIYKMLITLARKTVDDPKVRGDVVTLLQSGNASGASFTGYQYIKQARSILEETGYKNTDLYEHLRRWVAMH